MKYTRDRKMGSSKCRNKRRMREHVRRSEETGEMRT
jgi:hypothetical protein